MACGICSCHDASISTKQRILGTHLKSDAPPSFAIEMPEGASRSSTPTITWTPSPGATSYHVTVQAEPTCSATPGAHTVGGDAHSFTWEALADGTYHACVHAVHDGVLVAARNNGLALTVKSRPPGPFAIDAMPGIMNEASPVLTWGASATAVSYRVAIGSPLCANAPRIHDVKDTRLVLTALPDGPYAICVTALDEAGNATEASNQGLVFRVKATPPGSFAVTGPMAPVPSAPTVTWQAAAGALTYDLSIATDSACRSVVRSHAALVGTSHVLAPLPAGDYFACVTARDAVGNATKANPGAFPFTIRPAPQVTSLSPANGSHLGGFPVTLTGTGFFPGATVTLGSEACDDVHVLSATTLTCLAPAHDVGTVDVTVTRDDRQEATLAQSFTFVSFLYMANTGDDNVSAFVMDPASGALTAVPGGPFPAGSGPNGLTKDPLGRFLYTSDANGHTVTGFRVNRATGALEPIADAQRIPTGGAVPGGGAIDPQGKRLYVPNFWSHSMTIFAIDPETGALSPVAGSPVYLGDDFHPQNPVIDPAGIRLYVPSSGQSRVVVYAIDADTGLLTEVSSSPTLGGNPVNAVPHPSWKFMYTSNLWSQSVKSFAIDSATGHLSPLDGGVVPTDGSFPATIVFGQGGRFLYLVNYFSDSITAYEVDAATGSLAKIPGAPFSAGGSHPGDMAVDTQGKFIYVTNDDLARIVAFRLDPDTGEPQAIPGGTYGTGSSPGSFVVH